MTVASKIINKDQHVDDEQNDVKMREGGSQLEIREELLSKIGLTMSHLAGTVDQSEKERLQRLIFRSTRGTSLIYFKDIEQPFISYRGSKTYKSVYIVIYQQGEYYNDKMNRILSSFLSSTYELDNINFPEKIGEISKKLKDLKKVMRT
jgi:hypothetical protein